MAVSPEELKSLEKQVKKAKRIATEWAGQMHDLAEERLPAGFEEIPEIAQSTFDACKAWKEALDKLKAAETQELAAS